ncbi:Uncharacterised protein [Klebsiella variicola]|uniref:hypothetical protein n=1 Tax=Klebsiella variicola TaxID=244366 RepID=UPI000DE7948C|nr:hypothetical protein [Klebsiella variicola]SSM99787.1 Uncharacterised protein [Klebsiella variicola]
MTSKLNINWLNKCRCGNRMHTVETVRGSHVRLFEDDAVKCNSCGREGVIQTCDGIATVLWETDAERAEGAAMTKSTITRERLEQLADNNTICKVSWDERIELAQIALAAMDGEPVAYMYRQVQELRNRFGTCDEWEINCRLVESDFPAVEIPESEDYEFLPLYRHAQPATVVPDDVLDALQKVARIRLDLNGFDGDRRGIADCLGDAEEALIDVVNRCAAMLIGGKP